MPKTPLSPPPPRRLRPGSLLAKAALTVALAAPACGHSPPPPPCEGVPPVALRFETDARLNLDEQGNALAVTVRVLQLKNDTKLLEATFDDLLDRPAETLGEALLASDELALFPGAVVPRSYPRADGARVIGIVALFREPSGSFWRAARAMPEPAPDHCRKPAASPFVVRLQENRLDVR